MEELRLNGDPVSALCRATHKSEFEHGLIAERTKAGIAVARQRNPGKRWGRRKKHVDLRKARRLIADGVPKTEVARKLGIGRTTLYKALAVDTAGVVAQRRDE